MELTSKERQKIYDKWHTELYQTDLKDSSRNMSMLHKTAMKYMGIDKNSKERILDLACGKGLFLRDLQEYNPKLELYGTDISQVAVDEAKKVLNADLQQADAEKLPYKDNFFDKIVCLGGLEYFQDPIKGARETSRILKKDGRAIFFVPNLMFLGYIWLALRSGMMPTHGGSDRSGGKVYYDYNNEKFMTHNGWKDILEKGNLKVEKSYVYSYIGSTRFASPLLLWFYNSFLYKVIPFNLSYSFAYICKKN